MTAAEMFQIRQALSSAWLSIDILLVLIFSRYIIIGVFADGNGFRWWRARPSNQAAIGLLFIFGGLTMMRLSGLIWFSRVILDLPVNWWTWTTLIGNIVGLIGALCVARTFAPQGWGRRVWVGSLIIAALYSWLAGYLGWSGLAT